MIKERELPYSDLRSFKETKVSLYSLRLLLPYTRYAYSFLKILPSFVKILPFKHGIKRERQFPFLNLSSFQASRKTPDRKQNYRLVCIPKWG
jgi:hypothetical protein